MTSPYWRVWIGTEKKREGTSITAAGLAQSLDRLNEERKVGSLICGVAPVLWVLKLLRNEGTAFALQTTRPSRGLDENAEMEVLSLVEVKECYH